MFLLQPNTKTFARGPDKVQGSLRVLLYSCTQQWGRGEHKNIAITLEPKPKPKKNRTKTVPKNEIK